MMKLGLLFAISACVIWGLIFVVPEMLRDFTPLEVTLGRYSTYGLLSLVLFLRGGIFFQKIPLAAWGNAFAFALIANLLYYLGVVFSLRYATAPVAVLVLGLCPILIAFYGNWRVKEVRYRDLIGPSIFIMLGMVLVNVMEVDWTFTSAGFRQYIMGLLAAIFSLVAWSWYTVHNARFLKKHSEMPRALWATVLGVATLFWVIVFGGILFASGTGEVEWNKFITPSLGLARFILGALVLGFLCSWLGCYLWNQASSYLPVSLMGPLTIFETIFGLTYVYLYELRLPTLLEFLGILAMLGGIYWAVRNGRLALLEGESSVH